MEISDLRYFLAVAREESIKLASESLYISQPGLSKVIQRLEKELGKDLFIRSNRKIKLTDDGILLRKRAQEIIDLVDKTSIEFSKNEDEISGEVFIGAGESESIRTIAKTIKSIQTKYPKIKFDIFSGNADSITEKIDKGLIDFGVLIGVTDITKYDFIKLPIPDTIGVYMRKDSPYAEKNEITLDDLIEMPLIMSKQSDGDFNIKNWFKGQEAKLNIVACYNLIYNAAMLVNEGIGYACGIDKLLNTTSGSNLVFKPIKPSIETHSYLIWKKYQVFSDASKKFLEEIKNNIASEN